MEYIEVKSILNNVRYGKDWFGIDYNMNLYRGCSHGCIYCDSRSDVYGIHNFTNIQIKKDALYILENELKRKRNKGVIGIGSMSDPYNPIEAEIGFTRNALKLLEKYSFGVNIETKSDLITRDIDVLKQIQMHNDVIVKFTITCAKDELSQKIEPNVCVTSKRLEALKQISDAGIYCGVILNPVIPFVSDHEENIKEIVRLAYEYGAKFIFTYMNLTLRDTQRDYFLENIDVLYPGMKNQYILYYQNKYNCISPTAKHLHKVFVNECNKYGLLYKMEDIIATYQNRQNSFIQDSLF